MADCPARILVLPVRQDNCVLGYVFGGPFASGYHVGRGEFHGKETLATLYRRDCKADGPKYHVEYCFMPLEWCSRLREIEVGAFDAWVGKGLSDHVPLIFDIDIQVRQGRKPSKPDKAIRTDLEG